MDNYKIDIKTHKGIRMRDKSFETNSATAAKALISKYALEDDIEVANIHISKKKKMNEDTFEKTFKDLSSGLFKKIGKEFGVEIPQISLEEQATRSNAMTITTLMVAFLIRDKWLYVHGTKDYVIYMKLSEKGQLDCVKIPFKLNATNKDLLLVFADIFNVVKDRYSKIELVKEIFGEEKVNKVLSSIGEEVIE